MPLLHPSQLPRLKSYTDHVSDFTVLRTQVHSFSVLWTFKNIQSVRSHPFLRIFHTPTIVQHRSALAYIILGLLGKDSTLINEEGSEQKWPDQGADNDSYKHVVGTAVHNLRVEVKLRVTSVVFSPVVNDMAELARSQVGAANVRTDGEESCWRDGLQFELGSDLTLCPVHLGSSSVCAGIVFLQTHRNCQQ